MDLKTALNEITIDKEHVYQEWIQWATQHSDKLEEVLEYAFNGNEKERLRGSWILHHVSDKLNNFVYFPDDHIQVL